MTENDNVKKQMLSQLTLSQLQKITEELSAIKLFEATPCKSYKTKMLIDESIGDETKAPKQCRNCVKQCTLDAVKKSVDKLCETLNEPNDDKNTINKQGLSRLSTKDLTTFVSLCMDKLRQ
ncbi:589_t:CDS:2 [Paraglomus occultum]|uniref:589_t:CDS:1 n=1 Tax=Paraglomus occultum TaxID=144539 RepID=A0A9N9FTK7_9GLOM|nr:589_t:CDS:2 [Paraglomus occultum]